MSDKPIECWPSNWSDEDWNRVAERIADVHRQPLNDFLKEWFRLFNAEDREEILWTVFGLMLNLLRYGEAKSQERHYTFEFFIPRLHAQIPTLENQLQKAAFQLHANHELSKEALDSITRCLKQLARSVALPKLKKCERIASHEESVEPAALEGAADPHEIEVDDESLPIQEGLRQLEHEVGKWLSERFPDSKVEVVAKTAGAIARRLKNLEPEEDFEDTTLLKRVRKEDIQKLRELHSMHLTQPHEQMPPTIGTGSFGVFIKAPPEGTSALKVIPEASGGTAACDHVSFTVTAATGIESGCGFEINVWAHLNEQRAEMIERAKEQHGSSALSLKTKGPALLERGSVLTVELRVTGAEVYPGEDTLQWLGEVTNACFIVSIPTGYTISSLRAEASIRCQGLIIARLPFVLAVGKSLESKSGVVSTGSPFHSGFASYASEDRDEVIARIQGMQKALRELDVFFDVAMLRSGDRWQERLREEILKRDVLYLFWSEAASKSKWVDWEWRCAFNMKGEEAIDPVPLVSPTVVKPPSELAALHFNDWILAYKRSNHT